MNGQHSSERLQTDADPAAGTPVLRSWARCHQHADDLQTDPVILARPDLADRFAQHASLLRAAQPELETLAGMVTSTAGIVLLTDAAGVILQSMGDAHFLQRADKVALRPGVSWAEQHRGTNAVGTALVEGMPVRVHGREHYLPRNHILSCHGAPIRSPQGDILGVLDISCDAGRLHAYALELATMFARQVTNRLMEQAADAPTLLVFHRQAALLDSVARAQLLIRDGLIVGANDAATALLGVSWQQLLHQPAGDWLGDAWKSVGASAMPLHTPEGTPLFLRNATAPARKAFLPPAAAMPPPIQDSPARLAAGRATVASRDSTPALPPLPETLMPGFEAARRALEGGLSVLLQGETGTGKEVYARWLHARSRTGNGPFVAVNCGALPESLIEAELFGYAPGAFTGAQRHGARGRLREASGGTLFLDEIGDMPLLLQTRLLRALQEREVQPLGADKPVPVDFRLISATNQDLEARMQSGAFRADLYYRLQDHVVALPALRLRDDMRTFLCREFNRLGALDKGLTLGDDALSLLASHVWPGNYRELQAVLRGLVIHLPAGQLVTREDLPQRIRADPMGEPDPAPGASQQAAASGDAATSRSLHVLGERHIQQTLQACDGNISRAAKALGIHRSTLHRHLARRKPC